MATNTVVLFRGAATTNTATTLYTVPSGRTTIVTNIAINNTASSARTFTLGLGGVNLHNTTTIAPNTTIYIDCKQVMVATNQITGGASAADVAFHISGIEVF